MRMSPTTHDLASLVIVTLLALRLSGVNELGNQWGADKHFVSMIYAQTPLEILLFRC